MTKKQYAAYLCSEHWKCLRKQILDDRTACERCHLPRWLAELTYDQDLHVHHKTYANLGRENVADLEVLCRRCHDIETYGHSELSVVKSFNCFICDRIHWNPRSKLCGFCLELGKAPLLDRLVCVHFGFMTEMDYDSESYLIEAMEILITAIDMRRKQRIEAANAEQN